MRFKCDCSMRTSLVGDGCQKCNTELAIDCLPTSVELAQELEMNAGLTTGQAESICADIYQPLISLIKTLNEKINEVARAIEEKER